MFTLWQFVGEPWTTLLTWFLGSDMCVAFGQNGSKASEKMEEDSFVETRGHDGDEEHIKRDCFVHPHSLQIFAHEIWHYRSVAN